MGTRGHVTIYASLRRSLKRSRLDTEIPRVRSWEGDTRRDTRLPRDHAVIGSDRATTRAGEIESNRVRGRVPSMAERTNFNGTLGATCAVKVTAKSFRDCFDSGHEFGSLAEWMREVVPRRRENVNPI